ncbi:DNA cytosine methyltransferase [Acidithiobacillus concretivorus]|uniref:DNA (cytosine-5-)-methyltransferase n=1 Tax=Acidithiobacillus concretivorus TaxID=3063952 RepID=A0ABS5ZSC8_9PROT|nr:DNA cytosine methyltransferase [Acidithiobacillus concretivorus]MBU2739583.1 DNA cytosine methyltransferase [Acidithiobacillus concretivorus]
MLNSQFILGINEEITVDLFAGGGGMSTSIEQAIGRYVDVAVNHNAEAISMHEANHPQTRHYIGDVFEVDPRAASDGRAVGLLHLSPDCTHHSQASGGQPRDRKTRALSWVGKRWAGQVKPRVITLENVKQILQWGPLVAKRDKTTGRVLKLDGTVAEPGEVVPLRQQYLVPDKKKIGRTWQAFVSQLRDMGYAVEWKILCAADFGAPTTRERLFMVARCDGEPICWPEPTHTKVKTKGKKLWRSAAECIDWSIPCPSIFEREKPLAEATLRRIARGLKKYVLDSADPFIVPIAHYNGRDACQSAQEPLRTVTAYPKGGTFAVASPVLVQTGYGERAGQAPRSLDLDAPLGTVVAGGTKHALVSAYLAHLRGHCDARDVEDPLMTISAGGQHHGVVSAFLSRQFGASIGHGADTPLGTVTAGGGGKSAVVECALSPNDEAAALRVAAFLVRYYGEGGQLGNLHDPMATITTKDRLALVTVHVEGTPYVIVDMGLRMLQPRELYRAQGFPDTYIIEHGHDGRKFSKSAQVRMCGNSVSPPPAVALIRANYTDASRKRMVA